MAVKKQQAVKQKALFEAIAKRNSGAEDVSLEKLDKLYKKWSLSKARLYKKGAAK